MTEADAKIEHVRALIAGDGIALRARLTEIISRQCSAVDALEAASERQSMLIDDDGAEVEELLATLGEREEALGTLVGVERELGPFRTSWPSVLRVLSDTERGEFERALDTARDRLARIAERDLRDSARLSARRDRAANRLADVKRGRAAVSAYAPTRSASPRLRDGEA